MIPPDANAGFVAAMEDVLDAYLKIPNELMPYLAPLGWQHINLTGDYIWTEPSRLDGEGSRPLTTPSSSTNTDVLDLSA